MLERQDGLRMEFSSLMTPEFLGYLENLTRDKSASKYKNTLFFNCLLLPGKLSGAAVGEETAVSKEHGCQGQEGQVPVSTLGGLDNVSYLSEPSYLHL